MADATLDQIVKTLNSIQNQINAILTRQDDQSDTLDELVTKVDEINLPTGTGYSLDRES